MFQTTFLLGNEILSSVILIILFSIIFYSIGRIIQKKFSILYSYSSLALPIGYFVYQLVTFIMFGVILIFNRSINTLYWAEVMKIVLFSGISLLMIKDWIPAFSDFSIKKILGATFLFGTIVGTYYTNQLFINNLDFIALEDQTIYLYIDSLAVNGNYIPDIGQSGLNLLSDFTTFYNWQAVLTMMGGSNSFYTLTLIQESFNISIIVMTLFTLFKYLRAKLLFTLVPGISIFLMFMNGLLTSITLPFTATILFMMTMLYLYMNMKNKDRHLLYLVIASSFTLLTFLSSGLFWFIGISSAALYISQINEDSPSFILNLIMILLTPTIAIIILESSLFGTILFSVISVSGLVLINSSIINRNSDLLIRMDKNLIENKKTYAYLFLSLMGMIMFISLLVNNQYFYSNINEFYGEKLLTIPNTIELTNSLYSILFTISILPLFIKGSNMKYLSFLSLAIFIIFNPILIGCTLNLFAINSQQQFLVVYLTISSLFSLLSLINSDSFKKLSIKKEWYNKVDTLWNQIRIKFLR